MANDDGSQLDISISGPYIAFAHHFDTCPSDGTLVGNIRLSHFNPFKPFEKQRILWLNATARERADDSYWANVNMATRANNEWKENAFIFNFPTGGCSAFREHMPSLFNIIASKTRPETLDKTKPCRFGPGEAYIENETVSWEFPHFKIMPYGHYRFLIKVGKKNEKLVRGCLVVDCEAIPKPL